jgi:hypothetical protein
LYAARVAARLRRELQTDVDMVRGSYGEFKVTVDDNTVIDGGAAAFLGVMPSRTKIVAEVRERLSGDDRRRNRRPLRQRFPNAGDHGKRMPEVAGLLNTA